MKLNRAILNVVLLSWGYTVVYSIPRWCNQVFDDSITLDCAKSRTIFDIAFIICVIIAPSYVNLSGTRVSIFTGYICHILYVSFFLWPNPKLIYSASAVLGLGAALIFVAQGQCLTENSNCRTIHRHAWIYWLFHQFFLLGRDLMIRYDLGKESWTLTLKIVMLVTIVCSFIIGLALREPPREYSSGGLECIPNGHKVIEHQEPPEGPFFIAWRPLKDLLGLVFSSKMFLLSFMLGYAGLMRTLRYDRYTDDETNRITDIYVTIGEIFGAVFSAFCFCNKNGDSSMIVFMGLVMLAASFSFTYINVLQNKDCFWGNLEELSSGKLNYYRSMAMLERFSFGFGDACFHTQIYSLLGALFSKNSAPAFALAGLFYWAGFSCGCNYITDWQLPSQLKFFLATGMLAAISVAQVEILYVNRGSDLEAEKESLKSKETFFKISKEIPPEIKMLYAGFINMEKQEEIPREIPVSVGLPELEILSEK